MSLVGDLNAQAPAITRWQDIAYHPDSISDEYIEVWNFTHVQKDLNLYITFLVSNIGPDEFNNGIAILLYHQGKSKVITAEYARHSLQAQSGKFGIRTGRSFFNLCGPKCIALQVNLDQIKIQLQLQNIQFGPRLSDRELNISTDPKHFFSAFVPVQVAQSSGYIKHGQKRIILAGKAGMEYMQTNRSPHKYARVIGLTRSLESDIFALGYLDAKSEFKRKSPGRIMIRSNGKIIFHDYLLDRQVLHRSKHPELNFQIPDRMVYHTTSSQCKINVQYTGSAGGINVLGNISILLRWVLKVFIANPYIIYFNSEATLICLKNGTWQTISKHRNLISAEYLINKY